MARPGAGAGSWPATCTPRASTSPRSSGRAPCGAPDGRRPRGNGAPAAAGSLAALAPRDWFAALEPGREITRFGYTRCPLHDEQIPSLKLYDRPEEGWYCWGCGRGGDLIEYAAWRRHGRPARRLDGAAFSALVSELAARLGTPTPTEGLALSA